MTFSKLLSLRKAVRLSTKIVFKNILESRTTWRSFAGQSNLFHPCQSVNNNPAAWQVKLSFQTVSDQIHELTCLMRQ